MSASTEVVIRAKCSLCGVEAEVTLARDTTLLYCIDPDCVGEWIVSSRIAVRHFRKGPGF